MTAKEKVLAVHPEAWDCHWKKEGWHAIFSKPFSAEDHMCLHSEEFQEGDDYPFSSEEAAWQDAAETLDDDDNGADELNVAFGYDQPLPEV